MFVALLNEIITSITWQFLVSPTSVCLNRIHSQVTLSVTVPSTNLATLTSKTIHPASRHHAFSCGGWHFVLYQMSCTVICALHCVADVLSYQQRCNYFVSWLENKHGLAYVSLLYHMLHCSWVVCVVVCSSVVYTIHVHTCLLLRTLRALVVHAC